MMKPESLRLLHKGKPQIIRDLRSNTETKFEVSDQGCHIIGEVGEREEGARQRFALDGRAPDGKMIVYTWKYADKSALSSGQILIDRLHYAFALIQHPPAFAQCPLFVVLHQFVPVFSDIPGRLLSEPLWQRHLVAAVDKNSQKIERNSADTGLMLAESYRKNLKGGNH